MCIFAALQTSGNRRNCADIQTHCEREKRILTNMKNHLKIRQHQPNGQSTKSNNRVLNFSLQSLTQNARQQKKHEPTPKCYYDSALHTRIYMVYTVHTVEYDIDQPTYSLSAYSHRNRFILFSPISDGYQIKFIQRVRDENALSQK